jgi:hypothetical protein
MSVLLVNRHLSKTEYEQSYSYYFSDSERILNKCSKRRMKYIAKPIFKINTMLYKNIMFITSDLFAKSKKTRDKQQERIQMCFNCIKELNKRIMIYANVTNMEFDKQCNWCNSLVKVQGYLDMKVESPYKKSKFTFHVLDWKIISEFEVLNNMCELHRYCHGKAVRAKELLDDDTTILLLELIDESFYLTMTANTYIPRTKAEYEEREEMLTKALKLLYQIQRPMLSLFNTMHYSNQIQTEWSDMLKKEIKLLKGLQKSDKARFSKLS